MGDTSKSTCVECQAQKTESKNSSLSGYVHKTCEAIYSKVEECMIKHKGRVAPCQDAWNEFKLCHVNTRSERLAGGQSKSP